MARSFLNRGNVLWLPIFKFKRTEDIKQCVEYHYLEEIKAGYIFEYLKDFQKGINHINPGKLKEYGERGKSYVAENLQMSNMVNNAVRGINTLIKS